MANSSLHRVIEVAAPLWAGEAELVRSYWSSPKRTLETDLLWLKRQCFKEFWGSGVTKFDKGGLIPGSLKRLTEETANIDRTMDRHEFLDALEGVKAEFSHYTFFADVYDAVRPKGTPKLHPGMLEEWPEEKGAHRAALPPSRCARRARHARIQDHRRRLLHALLRRHEARRPARHRRPDRQRIHMRNAQFSYPLSEERVQAIYRGDIQPLAFDYERAKLAA